MHVLYCNLYCMVPLLPPGPQSLRPSGGSWIGRRLSILIAQTDRVRSVRTSSEMGMVSTAGTVHEFIEFIIT
jgi:hypothetical protein